jgi:light-regulated signal transduction histidine kinase (bacteriophytochrome)
MTTKLESQLDKTNQELAALKAEYEEFVYIVSHDLSAPLRQVEGFADIVVSKHADSFDEKTKRHFDLIYDGSAQATQILDAIKNYSRINTRVKPFVLLDSNKIVAQAMNSLSSLITATDASITCAHLPAIIGDSEQIQILFECLIENALTYQLPDNKPVIVISATDDDDFWQFCISDNGIGVAENLTEKIFKVLRRGVSSKKYPGLGMGLAITKKILQKHQGNISVALKKEEGAAFSFQIAKDLPYE